MDSIRSPLLPLERLDPQSAPLSPAGAANGVEAPPAVAAQAPAAVATAGGVQFEGDGCDVLALAAIYPISGASGVCAADAVSSVLGPLGTP